ncbi:hypothetical protein N9A94_05520 [Akkermansiaceae bacterium]|nr:hypothetical protein [Akkermansiaceae bacterium]MDB4537985.1 hypothetical protein [Akkermansiaceae bacterium]
MKALFLSTLLVLPLAAEITPEQFKSLHKSIQPSKEAWTTIPWQSSLIPAQRLALKENKPLFIWAMDGHPMGCV